MLLNHLILTNGDNVRNVIVLPPDGDVSDNNDINDTELGEVTVNELPGEFEIEEHESEDISGSFKPSVWVDNMPTYSNVKKENFSSAKLDFVKQCCADKNETQVFELIFFESIKASIFQETRRYAQQKGMDNFDCLGE